MRKVHPRSLEARVTRTARNMAIPRWEALVHVLNEVEELERRLGRPVLEPPTTMVIHPDEPIPYFLVMTPAPKRPEPPRISTAAEDRAYVKHRRHILLVASLSVILLIVATIFAAQA